MACLILFGDGASKFCGAVHPYNPPLGPQLFPELEKFDEFFAKAIPQHLKAEFSDPNGGFERAMAKFEVSFDLARFLRLMSAYFLQFEIREPEQNLFVRLLSQLADEPGTPPTFATLNYDLLFEDAWRILVKPYQHIIPEQAIKKLHGSPNFLPKLLPGITFVGTKISAAGVPHLNGASVAIVRRDEAKRWLQQDKSGFAPAIAVYAPGKQVYYAPESIAEARKSFVQALETGIISKIVIVGVNLDLADDHLWGALAKAKVPIAVVNPKMSAYSEWRPDSIHLADTFEDLVGSSFGKLIDFMKSSSPN
jgi:hypothetical protein